MSTFFSLPPAMNPTNRLSGDQNGRSTPSVPASDRASSASSGRIQIRRLPSPSAANTMLRPSGDTTGGLAFCTSGWREQREAHDAAPARGARRTQATAKPIAAERQPARTRPTRCLRARGVVR